MKIAAIVLGLLGSLAQLSIVANPTSFEPSSPPPAAIGLAIAGVVGALLAFKMLKLGGILMLISGPAYLWFMVTALQGALVTTETEGHGAPPGVFAVTLLLTGFPALLLVAAGIFALVSPKTKPGGAGGTN